jgi:hypothetical protein
MQEATSAKVFPDHFMNIFRALSDHFANEASPFFPSAPGRFPAPFRPPRGPFS